MCEWLIHSPARVKFVVTSVMFYPDLVKATAMMPGKPFPSNDCGCWRLFVRIVSRTSSIVSGDVHGSLTSRLTHSEDPDFEIHTIVSSPLCNSKLLPYAKVSTLHPRSTTGQNRLAGTIGMN